MCSISAAWRSPAQVEDPSVEEPDTWCMLAVTNNFFSPFYFAICHLEGCRYLKRYSGVLKHQDTDLSWKNIPLITKIVSLFTRKLYASEYVQVPDLPRLHGWGHWRDMMSSSKDRRYCKHFWDWKIFPVQKYLQSSPMDVICDWLIVDEQ